MTIYAPPTWDITNFDVTALDSEYQHALKQSALAYQAGDTAMHQAWLNYATRVLVQKRNITTDVSVISSIEQALLDLPNTTRDIKTALGNVAASVSLFSMPLLLVAGGLIAIYVLNSISRRR